MDELRRQWEKLEKELENKCKAAELAVEEPIEEFKDDDGKIHERHSGWFIKSATKAFSESARLDQYEDVAFALDTEFAAWRPIEGYEAIWSPERGVVEAELVLRPRGFTRIQKRAPFEPLASRLGVESPANPRDLSIPVPTQSGHPAISLRYASPEL